MSNTFVSPFRIGQRVFVDNDGDLAMVVTAVQWRGAERTMIECSYFMGESKSAWIEAWRLADAECGHA